MRRVTSIVSLFATFGLAALHAPRPARADVVVPDGDATAKKKDTHKKPDKSSAKADQKGDTVENTVTTPSGLKYVDHVVGKGSSPTTGKRVTVHYTGTLKDGKKFDSSVDRGQPFVFVIGKGQVIKGWDEGVMTMKVGGKRKLIIPANLAYGDRDVGGGLIPPNSELTFEVELIAVD